MHTVAALLALAVMVLARDGGHVAREYCLQNQGRNCSGGMPNLVQFNFMMAPESIIKIELQTNIAIFDLNKIMLFFSQMLSMAGRICGARPVW